MRMNGLGVFVVLSMAAAVPAFAADSSDIGSEYGVRMATAAASGGGLTKCRLYNENDDGRNEYRGGWTSASSSTPSSWRVNSSDRNLYLDCE